MKKFELVVPAYNEEKNLEHLIDRAIWAAQKNGFSADDFSLVIVNNGSRDNSAQKLIELKNSPKGSWFRVHDVEINKGYGHGLWQGLKSTQSTYIGWSHADLQCDPDDAFKALPLLHESSKASPKIMIKGIRSGRDWKDRCVSKVFETFAYLFLGLKVTEINAQPKVFERSLLVHISNPPENFAFDLYFLYQAQKNSYRFKTIQVLFPPRIHGVSNWASNFFGRYRTIFGMIKYMKKLSKEHGRA